MSKIKAFVQRFKLALAIVGGLSAGTAHAAHVEEGVKLARARATFVVQRPREWIDRQGNGHTGEWREGLEAAYRDAFGALVAGRRWVIDPVTKAEVPDPRDVITLSRDESLNVKTNAGIDFLHVQGYGTTGLGANGLNFIALSNDTLTETSSSTTLSTEIAANGLTRAAGTVAHTGATTTTTVSKTFTCTTTSQAAQKAALFTASSSGTMNHALSFTQRTLQVGDTLAVTFTITLS
jgi:hypothetical protein